MHELAAVVQAGNAGTVSHASDATWRFNGRPGAQVAHVTAQSAPETSFELLAQRPTSIVADAPPLAYLLVKLPYPILL